MIEPASLIGFGFVFLALSWAASAALSVGFLYSRGWLQRSGVYTERRASALVLGMAPAISLSITTALVIHSIVENSGAGVDHCPAHSHHLHLCLYHGGAWGYRAWVVAVVALSAVVVAIGMTRRMYRLVRASSVLRELAAMGRGLAGYGGDVTIIRAKALFCFTAGHFKPRVFVSSAAWDRLDATERSAMIEHELAHIEQGDLWRRSVIGFLSLLGAPGLAAKVVVAWEQVSERICDRVSALAVGDPIPVARALVTLSRGAPIAALPFSSSFIPRDDVTERVEAVLGGQPAGRVAARWLSVAALLSVSSMGVVSVLLLDPVHHTIETLLGTF